MMKALIVECKAILLVHEPNIESIQDFILVFKNPDSDDFEFLKNNL